MLEETVWRDWADLDRLPRSGASAGRGSIRTSAEDFRVEEIPLQEPTGEGEHLWLWVEKKGENTDYLARSLARAYGVAPVAISYAGRKDRHAISRQWFSVHLPGTKQLLPPPGLESESIRILRLTRSTKKLRLGALRGNRFEIVIRDFSGAKARLEERLSEVAIQGVPNYFGKQRFGRNRENLDAALAMFAGQRVRHRKRRGLYLSAARSALFNGILANRVLDNSWNALLPGEAVMLAGSNSFFVAEAIDDELSARLQTNDVHPSGALWGRGDPPSRGKVLAMEKRVAKQAEGLAEGLAAAGLKQERRSLRLLPQTITWHWENEHTLMLQFVLPAGAFATSVLRDLIEVCDLEGGNREASGNEPAGLGGS